MYVGVPTVIGAGGIERIVEIKLNKTEQKAFDKSVESVAACAKGLMRSPQPEDRTGSRLTEGGRLPFRLRP
jgi:hypothetical protein